MAPFLGLVAVALVIVALPPGEPDRFTGLAVAGVGFAAVGALIVAVPWERLPDWTRLGIAVLYCADVALVREATGGARSGFSIMLLLVVVWMAAYGTRGHIVISVALTAVTTIAPILLVGGDAYPQTEWRRTALFSVIALVVGAVVHEVVRRTSRERWVISQVSRLSRSSGDRDVCTEVCRLALTLTGADLAVLLEPEGTGVRVAASAGREVPPATLPADLVPTSVWRALRTGERQVILDTEATEATRGGVSEALGVRAWVHQPGIAPGATTPTVDLVVGWATPRRRISTEASFALPRLADEVAAIVDRADLIDRLDALTRLDPLTGLPNRRGWDDQLTREIARVGRTGRPLSVALLDLDRFKAFNDTHGHLVGDQLLKAAASAWSGVLRSSDVLARWGGEEFVVLMPETAADDACAVVARMAEQTPMGQTFSAGVVTITAPTDPDTLLRAADEAVYRAKAAGRARIEPATASRCQAP
ncbi:MAG TPA: sensor domain-containing diguanylate cyclase [Iamia sp.]|nr:sensor domain-containing diguanylate cyclase [Iamia sp.]